MCLHQVQWYWMFRREFDPYTEVGPMLLNARSCHTHNCTQPPFFILLEEKSKQVIKQSNIPLFISLNFCVTFALLMTAVKQFQCTTALLACSVTEVFAPQKLELRILSSLLHTVILKDPTFLSSMIYFYCI